MSRSIDLYYYPADSEQDTVIEVSPPYYLFGCQSSSLEFWSIPKLREIGITHLTVLGVGDPIYFIGWDMLAELGREIALLQQNFADIEFSLTLKAEWLAHLVYCYSLLMATVPRDAKPCMMIG